MQRSVNGECVNVFIFRYCISPCCQYAFKKPNPFLKSNVFLALNRQSIENNLYIQVYISLNYQEKIDKLDIIVLFFILKGNK